MVRHYFMRRGANVADLQINLVPKNERKRRARHRQARPSARGGDRREIRRARRRGRSTAGPPVLQTLVAEIYGPTEENRLKLAQKVIDIFHSSPVSWTRLVYRGRPAQG